MEWIGYPQKLSTMVCGYRVDKLWIDFKQKTDVDNI